MESLPPSQHASHDDGYAAVWIALVFTFLLAAAALAVDTSGAFNIAQTDQNTADLACLAGAAELPDESAARSVAYQYAAANWPEMAGLTPTDVGTTSTYSDGKGNTIFIEAEHGGEALKMLVRITETSKTYFGKAIGQTSIPVTQTAACSGQTVRNGVGMLPIGALAGGWNGDLFDCAAKLTGNCGALAPDSNGANAYRDAVANGLEGDFIKHHGNQNFVDPDTGHATIACFASPCNVAETEPGNMSGPWSQGLTIRFKDPTAGCLEDGWFNCDSLDDVLGESALPLVAAPAGTEALLGWQESLYGPYVDAQNAIHPDAEHYYYNGDTMNCDSVRLAAVPIVDKNLDWSLGDGSASWPNGRKDVKFIGFYTVYIREPSEIDDLGGPIDGDVIWFGPDAMCSSGEAFQPTGSTLELDLGVKLVAP